MTAGLLLLGTALGQGLDALPSLVGPGQDQGCTVARPVGDLDGDGLGDLVVGCPYDDSAGHEAGAAYVVLDVASVGPYTPLTEAGVQLLGEEAQDHAGWAVASPGDFDGDGTDDLAVSAPEASTDLPAAGKVYLLLGNQFEDGGLGSAEILRGGTEWGRIGERLYGPQDLDGDGFGDLLIGAPYGTPGGGVAAGWLAVIHGGENAPGPGVLSIDVQPGGSTTTTANAAWVHEAGETFFGRAALTLPDQTGDGLPELLVGAPGLTQLEGAVGSDHPDGDHPTGTLFVFASRDSAEVLAQPVTSAEDAMGVVGGDVPGDALPWVLSAGPATSVVLGAPQAHDGAGLVALVTTLAGEGLLTDRAAAILTGDKPGTLLGWSLAGSRGQLVDDNQIWIGQPGWDGGTGRLLAVAPGSGEALAESRAVAVMPGCWPGAQVGFDIGRGSLDAQGAANDWYTVTAPYASINAPRDGLVLIMDGASMPTAMATVCSEAEDSGGSATVDLDGDGFSDPEDCDDGAAWRNPGASEVCGDNVDDDCDDAVDEDCGEPVGDSGRCGVSGPASFLPVLCALGLVATRRRRESAHPGARSTASLDVRIPMRWRGSLPLVLLALPNPAQATDIETVTTAKIWGTATMEYLHGPVIAGDFDGDGQPDLAIANFQGTSLYHSAGEVHLLPANQASGEVSLLSAPVQLMGGAEHDYFGISVARVPGTIDGIWVGADRTGLTNREEGQAMLYLEPMGELGLRLPEEADLILTGDSSWDAFGRVIAVGDFDGDGLPDTAIGAPQRDAPSKDSPGRVWLIHGESGNLTGALQVSSVATAELDGATPSAFLGWRLLSPGDLDGDGRDDLVVGSLGDAPSRAGQLGVFTDLDPAGGLETVAMGTWAGVAADDEAGHGLDADDWDGDGVKEVLVGAPYHGQARGRVWLLDEAPQGVESLDDAALVILDGEPGEVLGASVAAGPLLLLGMPGVDQVRVIDTTGHEALVLDGPEELGHHLAWLEDLNGDGVAEAVAVAPGADGNFEDQGVALLLDGKALLDPPESPEQDLDLDGVTSELDCDDGDPRRSPEEPEICRNDLDDDCDNVIDEGTCQRGGCNTTPGTGTWGFALAGFLALALRRKRGLVLALAVLAGCRGSEEVTLEIDSGPLFGEVPIRLTGDSETLLLYVDGDPVAGSDTSPLEWTWDTSTVGDGVHIVRGAGFTADREPIEDWVQVEVDQTLADERIPSVLFRNPLDGDVFARDSDIFISLWASDDVCLEDVRIYRYGESAHTHGLDDLLAILPPEGPWEIYWEQATVGTWDLEAHVQDCVGHSSFDQVSIEVSLTTPLSCTLVEPTTGSEVSGTIDVKVAASSEAGIVSVTVTENGTVIETDIESPWGVTWEAGTLEREVTLAAVCIASDGAEAVDAVTVSVVESGTEDFEATLTRPQEGDPVSGDVIIKAAVGGGNGPASVAFWVDDTEIFVDTESPWEMTWDSTTWPDGAAVLGVTGVETKTGIEVSDSINVTLTNDG